MTKINKGCQRDEMDGTIRDRDTSITKTIWLGGGRILTRYLNITPTNGDDLDIYDKKKMDHNSIAHM